jgi:hypothetical protein
MTMSNTMDDDHVKIKFKPMEVKTGLDTGAPTASVELSCKNMVFFSFACIALTAISFWSGRPVHQMNAVVGQGDDVAVIQPPPMVSTLPPVAASKPNAHKSAFDYSTARKAVLEQVSQFRFFLRCFNGLLVGWMGSDLMSVVPCVFENF